MPPNHLVLCHPLLLLPSIFPSIRVGSSHHQSVGTSSSVLPMNIQDWFPLGLTDLISMSPRDSQESYPAPKFSHAACRILVPWPESKPLPLQWKGSVLTTGSPGTCENLFKMLRTFLGMEGCVSRTKGPIKYLAQWVKFYLCQDSSSWNFRTLRTRKRHWKLPEGKNKFHTNHWESE